MSKDLATMASKMPAHLRQAADDANEFDSGIGDSFPLPFMSIRGKEFRFRKEGQEVNTRAREMSVVLLAARPAVSKRFYESRYESGSTDAPDCSSMDGKTPDVAEPVNDRCDTCPNNAWGSKITESGKEGKACQDYKRLVIWPLTTAPENALVLDLSATNMKFSKEQRKDRAEMDFKTYIEMLRKHGMSPHQVVTSIAFTDADYPQLSFAFERFVDEDEWDKVQTWREDDDVTQVLKLDLHATTPAEGESEPESDNEAALKAAKAEKDAKADTGDDEAAAKKKAAAEKAAATKKAKAEKAAREAEAKKAKAEPELVYLMDMETDQTVAVPAAKAAMFLESGYMKINKAAYDKAQSGGDTTDAEEGEVVDEPEEQEDKQAKAASAATGDDDDASDDDIMKEVLNLFKS